MLSSLKLTKRSWDSFIVETLVLLHLPQHYGVTGLTICTLMRGRREETKCKEKDSLYIWRWYFPNLGILRISKN